MPNPLHALPRPPHSANTQFHTTGPSFPSFSQASLGHQCQEASPRSPHLSIPPPVQRKPSYYCGRHPWVPEATEGPEVRFLPEDSEPRPADWPRMHHMGQPGARRRPSPHRAWRQWWEVQGVSSQLRGGGAPSLGNWKSKPQWAGLSQVSASKRTIHWRPYSTEKEHRHKLCNLQQNPLKTVYRQILNAKL